MFCDTCWTSDRDGAYMSCGLILSMIRRPVASASSRGNSSWQLLASHM